MLHVKVLTRDRHSHVATIGSLWPRDQGWKASRTHTGISLTGCGQEPASTMALQPDHPEPYTLRRLEAAPCPSDIPEPTPASPDSLPEKQLSQQRL